ncbi:SMP-30/gluconolactonase/LRE family protein [Labedella endophytica]|jgi:sugar lactone lactonase YvrE|uniref:SMP-30/gluconolactonase/LRE family protein n=1 Tax=Labedella endophytica TaxID=1523160 RepID=A0A3S0VGS7_9MICO|nr:SMP-30/gluconolactonase/LRE family protein [Labedella endophytica]RUR01522.1 SMP-30/gluconolactonase/LRE family protein [Labedella endophytica]
MTDPLDTFRRSRAVLVESPYWDAGLGALCWVDITAGTVHISPLDGSVDGSDDTVITLPPPVSAVQPRAGGGFIVAGDRDRVLLLDTDGAVERELATLPLRHEGLRVNEGKVDPFGRFVIGGMVVVGDDPVAEFHRVSADGSIETLASGFGTTNGLEWSDDAETIYVTDTNVSTVFRAPYDETGPIGELTPFLVGKPSDGLVRDADGYFWNGLYGEGVVVRWAPDGTIDRTVEVPAPNVTGVTIGGPDLRTLFVGTARENLTEEDLEAKPGSGDIFTLRLDVPGLPVNAFAG